MKITRFYFPFILLIGAFISCNNTAQEKGSIHKIEIENAALDDIDKYFESFISKFSKDSLFQISRITFPLRVQELELSDSSSYIENIIDLSDHRMLDFSPPEFKNGQEAYTIQNKVEESKATIEVRGIDNGIITDFYFEKIEGKWMLVYWIDSST
jgi:hypothetical protein